MLPHAGVGEVAAGGGGIAGVGVGAEETTRGATTV